MHDPDPKSDDGSAGFREPELALLRALPLMQAETAELAIDALGMHFDEGQIGEIIHAYGMYRGLHTTMAVLGAEILDAEGERLSDRAGFGVVTMDDGSFKARDEVPLP